MTGVKAQRLFARLPVNTKLIQAYGQTEGAVYATHHEITIEDVFSHEDTVSIGCPRLGLRWLVVDDYLQPVIPKQTGELLISGK